VEHDRPRAHLVIDDFFDPKALATALAEVAKLEPKLAPGLVRDVGHDGQSVFFAHETRKNRATWIHEGSKTLELFRDALWSAERVAAYAQAREPLFQIIPDCFAPHLQVSSYRTGDHYDFHEDEGAGVNLTAIVFLARNPKAIRGGDLVLSYDGEETTVRFRQNRLLVFPSKTLHRVTPVRITSKDSRDARISLQCWLSHGRPPKKAAKRGAEADQPTFLLADEPIIAAAQALVASPDAPEQSPESVYWGAFYLSRILTANLRLLAPEIGAIKIRLRDRLEVYGVVGAKRIGFMLRGDTSPAEALSLFVERGRGKTKSLDERQLFPGTGESEARALLGRLLMTKG
jgi:hypothetical protein